MRGFAAQLARFGTVGLIGLVVDLVVFNVLRSTVLAPEELHSGPFIAKLISTSFAIAVNWMGNRHWTFREHRRPELVREGIQFVIVSIGGMLIALTCLWVSHYLLGFTSVLADNVSSNVIGLALGTAFRFWLYRTWVFRPTPGTAVTVEGREVVSTQPVVVVYCDRPAGRRAGVTGSATAEAGRLIR